MPLDTRASTVARTLASVNVGSHAKVFQPFHPIGGVAASKPSGIDALQSSTGGASGGGSAGEGRAGTGTPAGLRRVSGGRAPSPARQSTRARRAKKRTVRL